MSKPSSTHLTCSLKKQTEELNYQEKLFVTERFQYIQQFNYLRSEISSMKRRYSELSKIDNSKQDEIKDRQLGEKIIELAAGTSVPQNLSKVERIRSERGEFMNFWGILRREQSHYRKLILISLETQAEEEAKANIKSACKK